MVCSLPAHGSPCNMLSCPTHAAEPRPPGYPGRAPENQVLEVGTSKLVTHLAFNLLHETGDFLWRRSRWMKKRQPSGSTSCTRRR